MRYCGRLTVSSAWYRLLALGGAQLEAGDGEVTMAGGVLELQPAGGAPLRVPSAAIAAVAEPEPFTVLVTLADGTALELSRLGRMRTQLLDELRDARAEVAAAESGAVGAAVRFSAVIAGSPADLHVHEDALLVVGSGSRRIAFSFVTGVQVHDYTVTVAVAGQPALAVTRLGRRAGEFAALLTERLQEASTRTSAFLSSLLPGLDPLALRAAAGLLRDGIAVPARALDAVHPELSATLLRVATLPDRLAAVSAVADRADLAIGFKQAASVRRPAAGVTPWLDPSVTPHIGEHETPGGRFGGGLGGVLRAGAMAGLGPGGGYGGPGGYGGGGPGGYGGYGGGGPGGYGGYGGGGYGPGSYGGPGGFAGGYGYGGPFGGGPAGYGGLWAFRALGAGLDGGYPGAHQPMAQRASVRQGRLTPETEDLRALTVSGTDPTVRAFALLCPAGGGDPVAYEVLNLAEPVSYVYRAGGPDPRALVNQALDDAGFAPAGLHAAAAGDLGAARRRDAAASPLARALIAELSHDAAWPERLDGLLARS